jgi:hypothetical protein
MGGSWGIIGAAMGIGGNIGAPMDVESSIGLIEEGCVGIAPANPCPPNGMEPPNIDVLQ